MNDITLHHRDILVSGEMVHLARACLNTSRPSALHGHDFYELLWVDAGQCRHHRPERREDLVEGDLVFLRPQDLHGLQGRGEETMVVSITFHPDVITDLSKRHARLKDRLFWSAEAEPVRLSRNPQQMTALREAAARLELTKRDSLAAEGFLVALCAALVEEVVELPQGAPDWLAAACAAAADPEVFRDGAAGFARAAGRAHPHVSRTIRRYLNQSPSDYINTHRMAYAARRLAGSTDSLADIAADCGIPNLSHFHKLFREHHGTTPQRYRRAHQTDVVQPH